MRDYKNEYMKEKNMYKQIHIKISKEKAEIFQQKLKKNNKTITEVIENSINEYIEKN